jgi:uncharacterized membrane protein
MKKILLGVFDKHEDADAAIDALKTQGFDGKEISVISRTENLDTYRKNISREGTVTGSLFGGLAGLLIASTPILIPGVGIVVAGPLTALMGLTMGALTGGLIGALTDLGVSASQARSYETRVKRGGALLSVTVTEDTEKKARSIMKEFGAEELTAVPYQEHKGHSAGMHV